MLSLRAANVIIEAVNVIIYQKLGTLIGCINTVLKPSKRQHVSKKNSQTPDEICEPLKIFFTKKIDQPNGRPGTSQTKTTCSLPLLNWAAQIEQLKKGCVYYTNRLCIDVTSAPTPLVGRVTGQDTYKEKEAVRLSMLSSGLKMLSLKLQMLSSGKFDVRNAQKSYCERISTNILQQHVRGVHQILVPNVNVHSLIGLIYQDIRSPVITQSLLKWKHNRQCLFKTIRTPTTL